MLLIDYAVEKSETNIYSEEFQKRQLISDIAKKSDYIALSHFWNNQKIKVCLLTRRYLRAYQIHQSWAFFYPE